MHQQSSDANMYLLQPKVSVQINVVFLICLKMVQWGVSNLFFKLFHPLLILRKDKLCSFTKLKSIFCYTAIGSFKRNKWCHYVDCHALDYGCFANADWNQIRKKMDLKVNCGVMCSHDVRQRNACIIR